MASRVKRAPTSATRPAPLVMTTNWIDDQDQEDDEADDDVAADDEVAERLDDVAGVAVGAGGRVTETLIARRKSVVSSSSDGKTEKSSGFRMCIATSR